MAFTPVRMELAREENDAATMGVLSSTNCNIREGKWLKK